MECKTKSGNDTEARSRIIVAVEKNKYYIFVCVCLHALVVLRIKHATRMRHIVTVFCGASVSTAFFCIIT